MLHVHGDRSHDDRADPSDLAIRVFSSDSAHNFSSVLFSARNSSVRLPSRTCFLKRQHEEPCALFLPLRRAQLDGPRLRDRRRCEL